MNPIIEELTVVNGENTQHFKIPWSKVASIIDRSLEYDTHIHSLYEILDENGSILYTIENCPVVIKYKSDG